MTVFIGASLILDQILYFQLNRMTTWIVTVTHQLLVKLGPIFKKANALG